jgi:hypothetical protein
VQDSRAQWLEVAVGFDFDGDGVVDGYAPFGGNYPAQYPAPTKNGVLDINVWDLLKRENGKSFYISDLSKAKLVDIQLRLNKWPGIDLSSTKAGFYDFTISNSTLYRTPQLMTGEISASQGSAGPLPIHFSMDLHREDTYDIGLRIEGREGSKFQVMLDNHQFNESIAQKGFQWIHLRGLFLQSGNHEVSIVGDPGTYLDLFTATNYSFPSDNVLPSVTFSQMSSTDYTANISTKKPFVLTFADNFDDNWQAIDGNARLLHFRSNSFANGYYVNRVGQFTVRIHFAGQELRDALVMTSFLTFGLIIIVNLVPTKSWHSVRRLSPKPRSRTA